MSKKPIETKMRGETAYQRIKEEIIAGHLLPGSRVRETDLAERLNTSRTPVRDALRRLEADGLITHQPHVGAVITKLDQQSIIELYSMREVLEGTAARDAAIHASSVEIEDLREILEYERKHGDTPAAAAQINRTFHSALYQAAHNRFLVKTLESLSTAMLLLGPTTLGLDFRSATAREEHEGIVDAISARDSATAEAAARKHIRNAQKARLSMNRAREVGGQFSQTK